MKLRSWTICALSLTSLCMLAAWQYREFAGDRQLLQESLHREAHAIMNAYLGGIQSHRRRGVYFVDQLDGSLQGLVAAQDIRAAAIASRDVDRWAHAAGETELLPSPVGLVAGDSWHAYGFQLVEYFRLPPQNTGMGRGRQGRGPPPDPDGNAERENPSTLQRAADLFDDGGDYLAILVLNRHSVDERSIRAGWLRGSIVAGGMLLVVGTLLGWHYTLRTEGRARRLEAEARHLRELGQAAAGLAHETRNPLGVVRGWVQGLSKSDKLPPDQRQRALLVLEECDRVTARINEFLSFAKPRVPVLERIEFPAFVEELHLVLASDLEGKGLTLTLAAHAAEPVIGADPEMLRQTMFNLIENAIDASPAEGTIEIRTVAAADGTCRIEVADRGPGVATEAVESLFAPYFTTRPRGTGLGLAIVRHLGNLHRWRTGYSPRPGGGAVFWLEGVDLLRS